MLKRLIASDIPPTMAWVVPRGLCLMFNTNIRFITRIYLIAAMTQSNQEFLINYSTKLTNERINNDE